MFVAGFAQLDSVDEIDVILDFNRLYSDTSINPYLHTVPVKYHTFELFLFL